MEVFDRDGVEREKVPGRMLQRAIGRAGRSRSEVLSVGFARYSSETSPMEPHKHGEEVVYVLDASEGWVEWGARENGLSERRELAAGTVLHVPPDEWHVFRHAEGGFVDILFVFVPPVW